jgi:hypothetical protein
VLIHRSHLAFSSSKTFFYLWNIATIFTAYLHHATRSSFFIPSFTTIAFYANPHLLASSTPQLHPSHNSFVSHRNTQAAVSRRSCYSTYPEILTYLGSNKTQQQHLPPLQSPSSRTLSICYNSRAQAVTRRINAPCASRPER